MVPHLEALLMLLLKVDRKAPLLEQLPLLTRSRQLALLTKSRQSNPKGHPVSQDCWRWEKAQKLADSARCNTLCIRFASSLMLFLPFACYPAPVNFFQAFMIHVLLCRSFSTTCVLGAERCLLLQPIHQR